MSCLPYHGPRIRRGAFSAFLHVKVAPRRRAGLSRPHRGRASYCRCRVPARSGRPPTPLCIQCCATNAFTRSFLSMPNGHRWKVVFPWVAPWDKEYMPIDCRAQSTRRSFRCQLVSSEEPRVLDIFLSLSLSSLCVRVCALFPLLLTRVRWFIMLSLFNGKCWQHWHRASCTRIHILARVAC